MNSPRLVTHEEDVEPTDGLCGAALDLINDKLSASTKISLATVFIEPGQSSPAHYHKRMEEIYYFVQGTGTVSVGKQTFQVRPGSAVFIPLGEVHQVTNDSKQRLKLISADSPPFDAADIYYP